MTTKKLRFAVVGLDHYHTPGWVESLKLFEDQLEIVAIYDPNPALRESLAPGFTDPKLSRALDPWYRTVPFVTNLDQLIAENRPEIALVTLPNRDAPEAIATLATAGIHMIVDKPAAATSSDAIRAFDVARDNNVRVATGLLRRYGRGWQAAREMTARGRAGRILSTETVFNTSNPHIRGISNPLFSRELQGGGILLWLGVHDIDQLLWLTGERIVEVQAMAATVTSDQIDVEDAISVSLRFERGAIGSIHYAYSLPRPVSEGYLAIRGEKGSLSVSFDGTVRWIGPGDRHDPVMEETISTTSAKMPGYGAMAPLLISDLLATIDGQREPLASAQCMIDALRVIDAVYEAAETGKRVPVAW